MSDRRVLAELKRIAAEHGGRLRPVDVVAAAKPKTSPLHSRFEWDDTEAAHSYRLWQARQLISVTVDYIGAGEDAVLSRVFVSLSSDRQTDDGYSEITAVMRDPKRRAELLTDALDEMRRFQKKYAELKELSAVFAAMKQTVAKAKSRQPEAET